MMIEWNETESDISSRGITVWEVASGARMRFEKRSRD